jgi:hypothetical protein
VGPLSLSSYHQWQYALLQAWHADVGTARVGGPAMHVQVAADRGWLVVDQAGQSRGVDTESVKTQKLQAALKHASLSRECICSTAMLSIQHHARLSQGWCAQITK